MGVCGQRHAPGRFIPGEETPIPIVQKTGWAPGHVWTVAEDILKKISHEP